MCALDEDGGSCQSVSLVVHGEGGARHPDPYRCASPQDGGRSSFASSRCSGSLSRAAEMGDGGVGGIPVGLPQYRATIKPLMGYGDIMERHAQSPHRYADSSRLPIRYSFIGQRGNADVLNLFRSFRRAKRIMKRCSRLLPPPCTGYMKLERMRDRSSAAWA